LAEHLLKIASNACQNPVAQQRSQASLTVYSERQPSIADSLPCQRPSLARIDILTLKACIDSLQAKLTNVERMAVGLRLELERERTVRRIS